MTGHALSPAGCRRHTRALAWVRELDEGFEGTGRAPGAVLSKVKKAAAHIGLDAQHEVLLDKLFMLTQAQDWDGTSPVGPVVFGSNAFLADEINRTERSTKRLLGDLIELGLIAPRDSANGRRWGRRDEAGLLVEAYGFSLAPCAARYDEFDEAAGRRIADRKERGRLKATITREKKRIAAAAAKAEAGWALFRSWLDEVAAIVAQCARASLKRLRDLAARMTQMRMEAEAAAEATRGRDPRAERAATEASPRDGHAEEGERAGEKPARNAEAASPDSADARVRGSFPSPQGVINDTRITATPQTPSLWDSCGSQAKEEWSRVGAARPSFGPNAEVAALDDLEKHGIEASMVLSLVTEPRLQDLDREPDWSVVAAEAEQLAHDRRIDPRLTSELARVLGRRAAAVAIIVTARKRDRWQVRNEGGYLRRMLEVARTGELRMGRTVWGLVRAAEGERIVVEA